MNTIKLCAALLILLLSLAACGDTGSASNNANNVNNTNNTNTNNSNTNNTNTNNSNNSNNISTNNVDYKAPLGGNRPVEPFLPSDFDPNKTYPLIVLLHGFTASGFIQRAYFGMTDHIDERQFILLAPDGLRDVNGKRFWNATDYCCDFYNNGVDDVAYISGLIAEAKDRYQVDASRVYLMGHSNGGFMSYRMACDLAEEITALVSLAGATFDDPADCNPSEPVSVLQIHGTADATILYSGSPGVAGGAPYPSAAKTIEFWADANGCNPAPTDVGQADLTFFVGDETQKQAWPNCNQNSNVELWTLQGDSHVPTLKSTFMTSVLDFMFAQQKP